MERERNSEVASEIVFQSEPKKKTALFHRLDKSPAFFVSLFKLIVAIGL